MSMDDDADDDVGGSVPPLPPDDRLWRHPSELSSLGPRAPVAPAVAPRPPVGRAAAWPIALTAALAGAALCGGVLAVTGALSTPRDQRTIEKVALTPAVSSPMLATQPGVAALAQRVAPAVVRILVTDDAGTTAASGVVFRDDGLLYTSAHEVSGSTALRVVLSDGRRFDGRLVGADLPTDVAVVSIDADHLVVAVHGSSTDLEVGSPTIALGAPSDRWTDAPVTTGVVSALDRRVDLESGSLHGMIQTDAPIEAAWSGGPLLDDRGAIVGISVDAGGASGFGFAIPIDLVRRVAEELVATGKATHGWLGIEGADLPAAQAETMGIPGGASVRRVAGGSPAAAGGLEPGDVITEVDGHPVSSSSGLVLAMRRHRPGDEVMVGYWRKGAHHETTVVVDEHP